MSQNTALLVIDVQVDMFAESYPVYEGDALLERVRGLIEKARSNDVPVIYVQHNEGLGEPLETNSPGWEIHPFITPVPEDLIIQKHTPDSFYETNLMDELAAKGVTKLVVAGIQTDL